MHSSFFSRLIACLLLCATVQAHALTTEQALAMAAGELDVTVFQDAAGQGGGALDAALKLAKGETVEQKVMVPFQLVTPENMADFAKSN